MPTLKANFEADWIARLRPTWSTCKDGLRLKLQTLMIRMYGFVISTHGAAELRP